MRLIDADSITEKIMYVFEEALKTALESGTFDLEGVMLKIKYYLDNQPTAFDVDKVIEQLEKLADELEEKALTMNKAECFDFANGLLSKAIGVRDAIDIVKDGGRND